MEEKEFRKLAVKSVVDYFNEQADSTDKNGKLTKDQVFIVWECKILQNNKALLSTTVPDGMYYEVTWNGDKHEGYLDAYKKWKNVVIHETEDDESEDEDAEVVDKEYIYDVVGYRIPNDKCYADLMEDSALRSSNRLFYKTVSSMKYLSPEKAISIALQSIIHYDWEKEQFMNNLGDNRYTIDVSLNGERYYSQYNPNFDNYLDLEY